MWKMLTAWMTRVGALVRRLASRVLHRPLGRWTEGSYAEPHRRIFLLPLPQSKRSYHLYLPGRHATKKSWPLVVMLHGCKQDPVTFSSGTRMNEIADREGFLVLYPEQRRLANAYRCWNWFESAALDAGGEAALIAGMVREVVAAHGVDSRKVYLAGLSAGGAMTSVMASCYGELFAACAVHSGLMYRAAESISAATQAMKHGSRASAEGTARQAMAQPDFAFVPAMVIHGSRDDTVNPVNADQVVGQFLVLAGRSDGDAAATTESTRKESSANRYPFEIRDYRRDSRLLVRKVLVEGLGHAWSGGSGQYPFNDPDGPDASQMIWEFFSGFERELHKA